MRNKKIAVFLMFLLVSCVPVSKNAPTETPIPTPGLSLTPSPAAIVKNKSTPFDYPAQVSGIVLHYYYDASTFFPPEWRLAPIKCSGIQFDLDETKRVVSDIEKFASVYDSEFLKRNLTDIYLLDKLQCYGESYGGTNSRSSLYIDVGPQDKGYTDQFLQAILYSEFSSILMRNYSFPDQEWNLINDEGFKYSENAIQVVGQANIRVQTEELLKAGFLAEYGTTSLENDFNMFTEWLFTRAIELCDLRAKYEKIGKKADLAIRFYKSIHSEVGFSLCK
jgi:hypothetical protein